ncbi:MAG: hypothetical protein FWC69_02535 [Defluviitaleaceae bacterium]|nr:hypothetical protein [Defluviitaleaceae bacterium]
MMKKRLKIGLLACFCLLGLAACNSAFEWGHITHFSIGWGDFWSGSYHFRIEKIDGEYYFNATAGHNSQFFIPNNHPIPPHEVDALRAILEENSVERWDGFDREDWSTTGDWSFGISITLENDNTMMARGFMVQPDGFSETFPLIIEHLKGIVDRHKVEPEWGNLQSFSMHITDAGNRRIVYRISTTREDEVIFSFDVLSNSSIGNLRSESFSITTDDLERLHITLKEHSIMTWWNEFPYEIERIEGFYSSEIRLYVGFDNRTEFYVDGWVNYVAEDTVFQDRMPIETTSNSINALIDFFEALKLQRFINNGIDALFESSRLLESGISQAAIRRFETPETLLRSVVGHLRMGEFYVGMEVAFIDGRFNILGYGTIVQIGFLRDEIEVVSAEGEFWEFLVLIPIEQEEILGTNLWIIPR